MRVAKATAAANVPDMRDELDELTLARAQRGDEAAARALVERYQRRVFALLSRMLGGQRALVEDLAQETFLRVFRALPGFTAAGPARAEQPSQESRGGRTDSHKWARLSPGVLTIATPLGAGRGAR